MATNRRKRGAVSAYRGRLNISFYWHHPEAGPEQEYRWTVSTREEETKGNRLALERRLDSINALIEANAFFPCKEFPGAKIASFCRCPNCLTVSPLSQAHVAPRTLGELHKQYEAYEELRAKSDNQIIERSTFTRFKKSIWRQLSKSFDYLNMDEGAIYEYSPLTDYDVRELTPESVKDWLLAFQFRQERIKNGKEPNGTHYLKNMLSEIRLALEYGKFKRYWRHHPLLDYEGALVEKTKEEKSRQMNSLLFKPFSLVDRDRILEWLEKHYQTCPENRYKGKEKLRRFFLYHYCRIGFNTGLRSPSEMTALEWNHISYKDRELHVCQSREASGRVDEQVIRAYTKTIRHRFVPINQITLESLHALESYRQEEGDWIFWNPRAGADNPLAIENGWAPLTGEKRIRYTFNACLDELKIKSDGQQGQYRMRHTFTTLMLDHTNFSDAKVAALIGDNVETMKKHYAGFCQNRWKDEGDLEQMDAMNLTGKSKLKVVRK